MNAFAPNPTQRLNRLLLLTCMSCVIAAGCPQNPGNNPPPNVPGNDPPVANAGADQAVNAGASVTLDGSGSSDPDGDTLTFSWKQTLGTQVSLSSTSVAIITFTAPATGTALTFELTVSDGQSDSVAKINVSVHPVDALVQVTEIHQPSIKDDPAVNGHFPDGWTDTTPIDGQGEGELGDTGAPDGVEKIQFASPVEITLSPGDAHEVELQIARSSLLIGSGKWIGTTDSLPVTLSLDGTSLATGDAFSIGTDRGGAVVREQTTAGGRATLSVTNTSGATVKVLIILGAFAN